VVVPDLLTLFDCNYWGGITVSNYEKVKLFLTVIVIFAVLFFAGTLLNFFDSGQVTPIFIAMVFLVVTSVSWVAFEKKGDPVKAKTRDFVPSGQTKICPFCAETIRAEAKVCRFCGQYLDPKAHFWRSPAGITIGVISLLFLIYWFMRIFGLI
jgi:hypothetical protein